MSSSNHTNPDPPADPQRLTHELNNLLDASLRNLGLCIRRLDAPAGRKADDMLDKLRATDHALKQMASLIKRWSRQGEGLMGLLSQRGTLGEAVDHAMQLLMASADQRHVVMVADLSDEAADLPAGPVYSVLVNAIRNSLDAIDDADRTTPPDPDRPHRITITAAVEHQEVRLRITDTGAGLPPEMLDDNGGFRFGRTTKPHGHGVGLTIARDIAAQLGGQIKLANSSRRGAVLSLRYPVTAVLHPDPAPRKGTADERG